MDERTEQFLKRLEKAWGGVQPKELMTVVNGLMKVIKAQKEYLDKAISALSAEARQALDGQSNAVSETLSKAEQRLLANLDERENKLRSEVKLTSDEIRSLIPKMPDEFDPTDIYERLDDIQASIKGLPKPLTQIEVLSPINKELKVIKDNIEELKRRPIGRGGGGTSAIGVRQTFKYIAHTEEPTGDIDGVNTTYTLKNEPFWIAGFTLNGEQIAQLPNFTVKGRTITFATALPAAYSGKDFECKYIG